MTTIAIPGLAIGLELSPDQTQIFAASNDTLYTIELADNSFAGPYLGAGGTISTLNFFHFSEVQPASSGAIPEPSTGLLALLGLLFFAAQRRCA